MSVIMESISNFYNKSVNFAKSRTRTPNTRQKSESGSTTLDSGYTVQDTTPTLRNILRTLLSRGSLTHFTISILFALTITVTYAWGYAALVFFEEHFVCCFAFMTCVVLIFSPRGNWDGFFLSIGFGYGFFSILRLLYLVIFPWTAAVPPARINGGLQLAISSQTVEILSLIAGTCIASKSFRGVKAPIIAFFIYLLLTFFLTSAAAWWQIFPTCFDPKTLERTTFYMAANLSITIAYFLTVVALILRRKLFHVDVFTYLMVALMFRCISLIIGSAVLGMCILCMCGHFPIADSLLSLSSLPLCNHTTQPSIQTV